MRWGVSWQATSLLGYLSALGSTVMSGQLAEAYARKVEDWKGHEMD